MATQTADLPVDRELDTLNGELEALNLEGHWRLGAGVTLNEPKPFAEANVWRWADIRRILIRAGEIAGIEGGASRRTVRLCTPGLAEKWATQTIHASVQLVKPGEVAEAHRHTMGALRFMIEGTGGYTTVEGEQFRMEPGDLILTPAWTWHDHGNEGDGPIMWLDGHDFPLVNRLGALFYQRFHAEQQPVAHDDSYTRRRTGAMRPSGVSSPPAGCPYIYKAREAIAILEAMGEADWDPHDGFVLDYVNPVTGGFTLSTIGCRLQRLPAGKRTVRQRGTASQIFQVHRGSGKTIANGKTLAWSAGDAFVVPGWTWYEHASDGETILFSMNDEPTQSLLALLQKERA